MTKTNFKRTWEPILWTLQLLILFNSFFAFTSTIEGFHWYNPIPIGTRTYITYLIPLQLILIFIFLMKYKDLPFKMLKKFIPIMNGIVLFIAAFSILIHETLFTPTCILMAFLEACLILTWIELLSKKHL